jgi:hypothetical protein
MSPVAFTDLLFSATAAGLVLLLSWRCCRVGASRCCQEEEVEEHVGDVSPIASTDSLFLAQDEREEEVEEHVGDVSPIASTDSLFLAQDEREEEEGDERSGLLQRRWCWRVQGLMHFLI